MKGASMRRREFLRSAGRGLAGLAAAPSWLSAQAGSSAASSGSGANCAGSGPGASFNVRDFGATGDGTTKDTAALQQAIDRCWALGGREVVVPAGKYLTGALELRSNTTLRLENDATLLGSPDLADYPVMQVRWEGKWIQGHVGLIYAVDAENIAITGPGTIAGNEPLGGRPSKDDPLRRPALIEPMNCRNVRFEGFTTSYRRMWSIHLTYCEQVHIRNLTIRSTGGNGDGIDVDSSSHVWIDGCDISTGDDCISLKSGRGSEANTLMRTTEDVHITNCTFADSIFACIGIGSETSGGIRGVTIDRCNFTGARSFAIYIKTRIGRGAFIEDISCTNLRASGMRGGFLAINGVSSGLQDQCPVQGDAGIPALRNYRFARVHVEDCPMLVDAARIDASKPLEGFSLSDVTGTCAKGVYLANMRHAAIRGIDVTGVSGALLNIDNVTGTGLKGAAKFDAAEYARARERRAP
ncbi:MAG TPA: glycoside hydrolase family 28 protein [Acidobacteriaceae bacterium]|nr:glycoside hydrolase family 28 protein [Acidobacteriaceae bacterium]